jgi:hypothetical protein
MYCWQPFKTLERRLITSVEDMEWGDFTHLLKHAGSGVAKKRVSGILMLYLAI